MSGKNLHSAKANKNDEFYTRYEDIDAEVTNYCSQFRDKVVYCNCDSPLASNFFKYFLANFKILKLKKLICTCYDGENPPMSELFINANTPKSKAYKVIVTDIIDYDGDGRICIKDAKQMIKDVIETGKGSEYVSVEFLNSDNDYCAGDFRSKECVELLKEADIVCTNPPFSLFRDFVGLLEQYNKKYLILGNMNAITYKEIFPLIKENKMWAGYSFNKTMEFIMPDDYELKGKAFVDELGNKHGFVPGICWFTNLDVVKRHIDLPFHPFKTYNKEDYPTYDNYDAIEVGEVKNYPNDYFGVAGVPISYLDKYNPEQFEIIGLGREYPMSEKFVNDYYASGGTGAYKAGNPLLGYYDKDGKAIIPYMRILVRRLR